MADAEAAGGAGEASVGDQRHLVAHALSIERGGGGKHLAHAGTALRPLIADDQHVAFLVGALGHRLEAGLLAVEAAGRPGEFLVLQPRHLHDGAVRREVALQPDHAAGGGDRVVGRADHVLVRVPLHRGHVLGDGAAGHGEAVAVQEAVLQQRLHQQRDAAGLEHVLGDVAPAGLEVGDIGRAAEDLGDVEQVELDADLMRHGRQVQRRVGRAARGGDHGGGVLQRLQRDDVARADIAGDQLHDLLAGGGAELVADLVRRRRAGRIGQSEADRLGNGRHGVGGELRAAGAGRGARHLLDLVEVLVGHQPDRVLADRLEHVLHRDRLAAEGAGQDRAAIDEDRRHVEAQHRHHHAGQRLVAAGEADQGVIGVAAHGELDRVGDHLARSQRGLHALMAHGDAVGDGDGAELAGVPAAEATPFFTACAWRISEMLHGAASFQQEATPTSGWWICSWSGPSRRDRSDAGRVPGLPSRGGSAGSACR